LIDFHFDPPEFWLKKNPKTISYAVDPIFALLVMNQKNLPNTKATVEAQSVASIEHFDPVYDNLDSLFFFYAVADQHPCGTLFTHKIV